MLFIIVLYVVKNLQRFLGRCLLNNYFLEPALQCSVLFNILAVFIKGGRSNALNLTTGKGGLQQIGGIHGSL